MSSFSFLFVVLPVVIICSIIIRSSSTIYFKYDQDKPNSQDSLSLVKLIMAGIGFTGDREVAVVTDFLNYEIGDFVLRSGIQNKSIRFCTLSPFHEEAIACKYSKAKFSYTQHRDEKNNTPVDYKFLNALVRNYTSIKAKTGNPLELPNENTTVVHLRLGDIITNENCHEKNCNKFVYTKANYLNLINSAKNKLPRSNRIVIVGFMFHLPLNGSSPDIIHKLSDSELSTYHRNIIRSIHYRTEIAMLFRKHFDVVEFRGMYTPDEDFAYMCSAKHYVQSGGHYSSLIGSLVKLNKGIVYYP